MINYKSFLLMFLFFLWLAPLTIAMQSFGEVTKNSAINLTQTCTNSTYSNITRIIYPIKTFAIDGQYSMTKTGDDFYYYWNDTTNLGQYLVYGHCDEDGVKTSWQYDFNVTPNGFASNPSTAIIYAILLISSLILMLASIWGALAIDGNNQFTMGGDLVEINIGKFYKLGLFFLAYLFAIFTSYLAWQVSSQYLLLDSGSVVFYTLFEILWILLAPMFVLVIIVGFVKWFADVELHKLAERGLRPR